ncbi:hypothetical protein BLOT_010737 [Blomia tropicalis]|nr:hypothetical protein BLOT_010737 [Blomia tropicalis]
MVPDGVWDTEFLIHLKFCSIQSVVRWLPDGSICDTIGGSKFDCRETYPPIMSHENLRDVSFTTNQSSTKKSNPKTKTKGKRKNLE